jgi:hypothetical protein
VHASTVVDDYDAAPAGVLYPLWLEVQRQVGAAAAGVPELTLDVSHDDGATGRMRRCCASAIGDWLCQ